MSWMINGERVSGFRLGAYLLRYTWKPSSVMAYLVDTGELLRVGKKYIRYIGG